MALRGRWDGEGVMSETVAICPLCGSRFDAVVQLTQQREIPVTPEDPDSPTCVFRGGTTLILDEDGRVRYLIGKSLESVLRRERQVEFMQIAAAAAPGAALTGRWNTAMNLAALHRGY